MKVIRAESLGMCFGVRDALAIANSVERPERVTVFGELVHNPVVIQSLAERGFTQVAEVNRQLPESDTVLITAHGISLQTRARLEAAGKQLIDSTCPLVTKAHDAAQELARDGRHVLVLGRRDHVEVRGIVEDLPSWDVIERVEDARPFSQSRLGIVCQTTMPPRQADEICSHLQLHNPLADIRRIDTICQPTRQRQDALRDLVARVDAIVVVGGPRSNNTQQLVKLAHQLGRPAISVQGPDELDPAWFADVELVGLTAGTSTLDATIDRVHERLLLMRGAACSDAAQPEFARG